MKRLIIGSTIAFTLATGVFLLLTTVDSTETRSGLSAAPARKDTRLRAGTAHRPFAASQREASRLAATNRFEEQATEIAATPPTTERENAIRELAHEWAAKDPAAAELWAASFDDPEDWERAMTHVCLAVARANPREGIEIAKWYNLNAATIESIIEQWAKSDFPSAIGCVEAWPTGTLRDNAFARLTLVRADASPAEAASMVSSALNPGPEQEEAAIAVLYQWLLKDPAAAGQWVKLFPEGHLKERAQREIQGMEAHLIELRKAP